MPLPLLGHVAQAASATRSRRLLPPPPGWGEGPVSHLQGRSQDAGQRAWWGHPFPSSSHPDFPWHEAVGAPRPGCDSCLETTRNEKGSGLQGAVGEAEQPPDSRASRASQAVRGLAGLDPTTSAGNSRKPGHSAPQGPTCRDSRRQSVGKHSAALREADGSAHVSPTCRLQPRRFRECEKRPPGRKRAGSFLFLKFT